MFRSLLFSGILGVALVLAPSISVAHGNNNTSQKSAMTPAEQRDHFVSRTNDTLDKFKDRVSKLKDEKDRYAKDSREFRDLDIRINAMEGKLKEANSNLDSLKSASDKAWREYESPVNHNIAQLKHLSTEKLAE